MRVAVHILSAFAFASSSFAAGAAAVPPQGTAPRSRIEPAAVLAEVRRLIAERYVLPDRRPALDAVLAEGLRSGRYQVQEPALLAERVNADLARVGQDRHLYFSYDPKRVATMMARTADGMPDPSAFAAEVRRRNHGVRELRLLAGNVRYLDLTAFDWIGEESEATLNAAMAFLKGGDAAIIDLRRNGGGDGRAVHQIVSHFMAADTPLITFHKGSEESPTLKSLSGLSDMLGKPLYVLTSRATGSAAEELVGHVAGYGLGEVVGTRTSGGAYMNELFAIEPGFELSVSVARPVLAATGKDWEAVGIAPTIAVPAEAALETAHLHALRRLAAADPLRSAQLEAVAVGLEAIRRPGTPAAPLASYAGDFGKRRIVVEDGRLWYRQGEEPPRLMVPLGGHAFTLADDPLLRLTFATVGQEAEAFDLGPAGGPVTARFERSRP